MHESFVSYHHANDQAYKEKLLSLNKRHQIFIDGSVDTGDISDELSDESIRTKIRDEYLQTTSVTIVLVGAETKKRKHIDWELYSSMIDGLKNKKSGIVAITLPSTGATNFFAAHNNEKTSLYPDCTSWCNLDNRAEYENRHPYLPARLIDNLVAPNAQVSVTNWSRIEQNPQGLALLISNAHNARLNCEYDLSRRMRRQNS